jgi:phosphoglycolate phosphatase
MKQKVRDILEVVKRVLIKLSFRTGVMVLVACAIFYILSFAQALLPISASAKSVLFIILFGMAKLTQYTGLAIVGVKGWRKIKMSVKYWIKKRQFKRSLRERDNTNK